MSAGVPGLYYSWFPDLMPHDHEMRGFITAFSNMFSFINQIWYTDAVWRTSEAPEFKPGFISAASFGVVLVFTALLMRWLEARDVAKGAAAVKSEVPVEIAGESLENSNDSSV
jgi:hypothetical protein